MNVHTSATLTSPATSASELTLTALPIVAPPLSLQSKEQPNDINECDVNLIVDNHILSPTVAKNGRRSKFNAEQDLALVREVAAARAHVAIFGETQERFETAALILSESPLFTSKIAWKTDQDRFKRLQEHYDENDTANQRVSGIGGGEMGKLANLLMTVREARDDMIKKINAARNEQKKQDVEKEEAAERILEAVLNRKRTSGVATDVNDDCEDSSRQFSRKKRRFYQHESEVEAFGAQMKEAEMARVLLEEKRLDLDRDRFNSECAERQKDREERAAVWKEEREERERERVEKRAERREEREAVGKVEIEKFKMMMNTLISKR